MFDAKMDACVQSSDSEKSKRLQAQVGSSAPKAPNEFGQYFEVFRAESQKNALLAHRLRYQVYCVENKFENAAEFPDGIERDQYDSHSHHALLWHRAGQAAVGTVRLITSQGSGFTGLPVNELPHSPFSDMVLPGNAKVGEVSRFCVVKGMRQRDSEDQYADIKWPYEENGLSIRRHMPNVSLGLMRGVVMLARAFDVSHLCAVMDPALLVMLRRLGINFEPVGPKVNYHGIRQPCHRALADISAEMRDARPSLWDVVFGDDGDEALMVDQPAVNGQAMDALQIGTNSAAVPTPASHAWDVGGRRSTTGSLEH